MSRFADPQQALAASTLIASAGIAIATLELLSVHREWHPDGLYAWRVFREARSTPRAVLRIFDLVMSDRAFTLVLMVRAAAALALVASIVWADRMPAALLLLVALTGFAILYRFVFGLDGSDQMASIVVVAAAASALLPKDGYVPAICALFVAGQSVLAYFASGVAKALSAQWRDTGPVALILSSRTFGIPPAGALLLRSPRAARLLSWSVIVLECLFPLVLVLPAPLAMTLLASVAFFHVACAVLMGLNIFPWSFIATFPAVWFSRVVLVG